MTTSLSVSSQRIYPSFALYKVRARFETPLPHYLHHLCSPQISQDTLPASNHLLSTPAQHLPCSSSSPFCSHTRLFGRLFSFSKFRFPLRPLRIQLYHMSPFPSSPSFRLSRISTHSSTPFPLPRISSTRPPGQNRLPGILTRPPFPLTPLPLTSPPVCLWTGPHSRTSVISELGRVAGSPGLIS